MTAIALGGAPELNANIVLAYRRTTRTIIPANAQPP
jgi:hypothetical protein